MYIMHPRFPYSPVWITSVLVSSFAIAVVTMETSDPRRYRTPRWVRREVSGALLNLGWR